LTLKLQSRFRNLDQGSDALMESSREYHTRKHCSRRFDIQLHGN
jgi:hypothetical protein